ncbi:hypothetical protein ACF07Y_37090 [Streptomyces sp. NPDC016566]|uniref:hypothetical protein n=1 Tax=Streptomyces sp. NPDC016566 TaxID=3364967 RepID=UPI0036F530EA
MDTDRYASGYAPDFEDTGGYQLPVVAWEEPAEPAVAAEPQAVFPAGATMSETPQWQVPGPRAGRGEAEAVPGALTEEAQPKSETKAESASAAVTLVKDPGPGGDNGEDGNDDELPPGQISRPMVAAAALAGLVLVGLPLVIAHLTTSSGHKNAAQPAPVAPVERSQRGALAPAMSPTPQKPASTPSSPSGHSTPQPSPSGHSTPQPSPSGHSTPAASTYQAVAGPGCTGRSGTFTENGWFTDGSAGWTNHSGGSFAGNGCSGAYVSVPMSGDPRQDDENSAVWAFRTGSVTGGSCTISFYVPDSANPKEVGGAPAYYTVQTSTSPGKGALGTLDVNQVTNRGQWVNGGRFPLKNGLIAVVLHTRGDDTKNGAHFAAAAVRADCSP